jgi:MFS family permease
MVGGSAVLRLSIALVFNQAGFYAFVASLPLAMVAVGRGDAEIGAIMGSAAVFSIVAALLGGGLIDRYGGRRVFLGSTVCYSAAAILLAAGVVTPGGPVAGLLVVRLLQGVGLAVGMASILSVVPALVEERHVPTSLAFVGMASNLSLALVPPLSLVVLQQASLTAVAAATVVACVAAGVLVARGGDVRRASDPGQTLAAAAPADRTVVRHARAMRDLFRPKWRPAWGAPLAIGFLFLAHWGVVTGYLPQRAQAAGADVGLFFTGDALALLALRVPSGYVAGRFGSRWLLLGGLAVTGVALALLMQPPTTPLMIVAGIGTGAGAALIVPTIWLELSQRSDETDRGSAFALFSVIYAMSVAAGSIGVSPFIEQVGFQVALGAGIAAFAVAAVIVLVDRSLRSPTGGPARRRAVGEPAI